MAQAPRPNVGAAISWLGERNDPLANSVLGAAGVDVPGVDTSSALERAVVEPAIRAGLGDQRPDGSWGDDARRERRILPTLRMAQVLADLGLASIAPWQRAADFLAATAHYEGGPFAVDGRRHNVLSCYVGIAAAAYLRGERRELAEPQLVWVVEHQDVRVDGACRRTHEPTSWDSQLATRFGGCMASTTCLLGLVKVCGALALDESADARRAGLRTVIREVLLERHLMFRRNGAGVVPLGVTDARAAEWLDPTFPLDHRTDLVEVLDAVTRSGPPDERVQPALEHLGRCQLPDGSWPLRRTFRPDHLPALERRSQTRGSPIVTARVVAALSHLSDR